MSPPSDCHMPLAPEAAPSFFLSLFSSSFFFSSFPPSCFCEPFPSVLGEGQPWHVGIQVSPCQKPPQLVCTGMWERRPLAVLTHVSPSFHLTQPFRAQVEPHSPLTIAAPDTSLGAPGPRPAFCLPGHMMVPAPQSPAESLQEVERLLCSHCDTWLFVLQRSPLRGPRAPSTEAGRTFLESAIRTT